MPLGLALCAFQTPQHGVRTRVPLANRDRKIARITAAAGRFGYTAWGLSTLADIVSSPLHPKQNPR